MKRLNVLFAVFLLLCLLPMWRFLDYAAFLWPSSLMYTLFFALVMGFFLLLPLSLLIKAKSFVWGIAFGMLLLLSYLATPLSRMATLHPELSHCGTLTYTGFMYPINEFMSEAYGDDLVARNQMCWVRKLLVKSPTKFNSREDQLSYLRLLQKKLLAPKDKFKVSLPLIALLYGHVAVRIDGNLFENVQSGKFFLDSLQLWKSHYTFEISTKQYDWWDWPHATWIGFEYGLIEENWEDIVQNITIEEN